MLEESLRNKRLIGNERILVAWTPHGRLPPLIEVEQPGAVGLGGGCWARIGLRALLAI